MSTGHESLVSRHYGGGNVEGVLQGVADLAGVDHFHTRGEPATLELAALARIQKGHRVLDIGGGLGGAARLLASRIG